MLRLIGGRVAAAGGAGITVWIGGLWTGGLATAGGSLTPVTAAIGRTAGRSVAQSIPNMTLQTATIRTATMAINDFVQFDSDGNMVPSQRQDHTAGSAPMRKAGR